MFINTSVDNQQSGEMATPAIAIAFADSNNDGDHSNQLPFSKQGECKRHI
jgi:hypothetical protein